MGWNIFKSQDKFFLAVDIGTEGVKAVIFCDDLENPPEAIGFGQAYYDRYDISGSGDFGRAVLKKAVSNAMSAAKISVSVSIASRDIKSAIEKKKSWRAVAALPVWTGKSKIATIKLKRERPKREISQKEAGSLEAEGIAHLRGKIAEEIGKKSAISPNDIIWARAEAISLKIDGYQVDSLKGSAGEYIEETFLLSFTFRRYLKMAELALRDCGINRVEVAPLADCVSIFSKRKKIGGFLIDVGGEATQIFAIRNGEIVWISDFSAGAAGFGGELARHFGIGEATAREMAENYCAKKLSPASMAKVSQIFKEAEKIWYNELRNKLSGAVGAGPLPPVFRYFGGGSFLPEIKNAILENVFSDFENLFLGEPKLRILQAGDLGFKLTARFPEGGQFSPCLLLIFYHKHHA